MQFASELLPLPLLLLPLPPLPRATTGARASGLGKIVVAGREFY
jgi:hypothetical protein